MDKFYKIVVAVMIGLVATCGLIVLSGIHSTVAPAGYVLTGNFTVQNAVKNGDETTYLLIWHGTNGTAQLNGEFSYVYTNVPVFEGKNVTVTVKGSPMTLYENYTRLMSLNP
ncbi:MAG: hypothetical protein ABSA75_02405 [Candidatus Bathyarchaeia archaeon]